MFGYNVEEKKVNEAIQQVYRDFALKYGEIQKSELSESEKQAQISELIENASNTEQILQNTRSLSEISIEDKENLGIKEQEEEENIDTNVIDTLVSIYARKAKMPQKQNKIGILENLTLEGNEELEEIDTSAFEEELRQYFTEHYTDLLGGDGYNYFLSDIAEVPDDMGILHNRYGDLAKIAIEYNIDPKKFNCFGYQLTVQDGLVAEEDSTFGRSNIFYATPKAINQRIFDLYSKTLFREQKNKSKDLFNHRELKNIYITYAEKNGIEIQNKDVLEELPIDMDKVKGIANYINRVLNDNKTITTDLTEELIKEIQKDYSKIMNLTSFNFGELETVKNIANKEYVSIYLSINKDSILKREEFSPDIAYGTSEFIKSEYQKVMSEVERLSHTDAFKDGYFDVEKVSKQKEALRRYITEYGIEGIDISIPNVEIDHQKTEMIANAILNKYGEEYEDKEAMKEKLIKKIEDKYPEIYYERQVIGLNDLIGEELKEMGEDPFNQRLYMQKDFVYIRDYSGFDAKCLYATPKSLLDKIAILDEKISTRDFTFEEKRIRETLVNYAKENNLEIQIPNVESVEQRRKQEKDIFSFKGDGFSFLDSDLLPDDPTARKKIELDDSMFDIIYKISEGVPGAIVGIAEIMKSDKNGFMLLLGLDDMNIRGSQIWQAYKYLYNEDGKKFAKAIGRRDKNMVDFINQEMASAGEEKAVISGAAFDRNKDPNKYRFTELEVEQLKIQRQERIEKQKEAREKMIANSPAKKYRGAKKRAEREAKKQEYRQKLINAGKKSIGDLDEELTQLQDKEQQAKELYEQYEEKISDISNQEL